jgi:hypothetical protein
MMLGNHSAVKVPYLSTLHRPECGARGQANLKWLAGVVGFWRQNAGTDDLQAKVNLHHDWQGLDMFDTHGNVPYTCIWPQLLEMESVCPARSNFPNQDPYHNKQLKKMRRTLENQSEEVIHTCVQTLQNANNVKGLCPRDVRELKGKTVSLHAALLQQRVLQDNKRQKITPAPPVFPPHVPPPHGAVEDVSDEEAAEEKIEPKISPLCVSAPWHEEPL